MNAVLIIDKPAGLTSHDVVNRVRRILHERSVGHLGTLDPLATGVLPLVIGNLTRLAQFYTSSEKTYEGTIRFGFATDTYDAEGEATSVSQAVTLSVAEVRQFAIRFQGKIEQLPPPFSAKKIRGVPAYKLARKHAEFELKPVLVEIKQFEITQVDNGSIFITAQGGQIEIGRARLGDGKKIAAADLVVIGPEVPLVLGVAALMEACSSPQPAGAPTTAPGIVARAKSTPDV